MRNKSCQLIEHFTSQTPSNLCCRDSAPGCCSCATMRLYRYRNSMSLQRSTFPKSLPSQQVKPLPVSFRDPAKPVARDLKRRRVCKPYAGGKTSVNGPNGMSCAFYEDQRPARLNALLDVPGGNAIAADFGCQRFGFVLPVRVTCRFTLDGRSLQALCSSASESRAVVGIFENLSPGVDLCAV